MSTIDQEISIVSAFLIKNGFEKIEDGVYGNDYCSVSFEGEGYAICDNEGYTMYSDDHNIYFLVGYLTWCGFLTQNYKK